LGEIEGVNKLDSIAKNPWSKNWENKLPLFSIYLGPGGYFKSMKKIFGYSFSKILIDCTKGVAACYLLETDLDNFAKRLLELIDEDESVLIKWADKMREETDKTQRLYKKKPEWFLSKENLEKFVSQICAFGVYQIAIKEASNRLREDLYKKYIGRLESARRYGETLYFDLENVINSFLKLIAKKKDYSLEAISSASVDEILSFLKEGSLPSEEILLKRREKSGIYFSPEPVLLDGEEIREILKKMVEEISIEGGIKGNSAYKGKIKGRCKVIKDFSKIGDFKEGDILVTGMTDPRYVPIMKKAGAIVTDAGGILSHAAIVSRELKKPCVIGTKIATQVFRDGDLVEVDANEGVVRVLKKKVEDIIFEKAFSRDVSLIMAQIGFPTFLDSYFGKEIKNPYGEPYLGYMNEGVVEYWVNQKALDYFNEQLLREIEQNLKLSSVIKKNYFRKYKKMMDLAKSKKNDLETLEKLISAIKDIRLENGIMFSSAMDENWPNEIRDWSVPAREADEMWDKCDAKIRTILKKLFPELKEYGKAISPDEIENPPSIGKLKEKTKEALFTTGGHLEIISINDYLKREFHISGSLNAEENVKKIEGSIAFKGKVKGKVRILNKKELISSFKEGEVLVSPMTTPDYVSAMKKAAAIITDEGGATCHVAIVARELKKPTIIGTKIASKILKDGDLVEVDADKGIVRVLEKTLDIKDYLKNTELDIAKGKASVFTSYWAFSAYSSSSDLHGIEFNPVLTYIGSGTKSYQILDKKNATKLAEKIYSEYLKDEKSLIKKMEEHLHLTKEISSLWEDYKKKPKTKKEILKPYRKFMNLSEKWWHYTSMGEYKEAVIEAKIIPYFKDRLKLPENKITEIVGILSHPDERAIFNLERIDFLNICLYILSDAKLKKSLEKNETGKLLENPVLKKLIKKYLKNYFWAKTDFYEAIEITPSLIIEDSKKEIKTPKNKLKKEIEEIVKSFEKIKEKKKKLIKKLKLNREDMERINLAREFIYWIDKRKLMMMKIIYYWLSMLREISKKVNINYENISLYSPKEVEVLLSKGKEVDKEILDLRKKNCFIVFEKEKEGCFFYGEEAKEMLELATKTDVTGIKGTVASSGEGRKIVGIAKIITDPLNEPFEKGEILVTSMTRVEFVPLMRKAKAIITDEGGLACHAAIVSRELNVPAIIGTKVATRVLKSGDLVEVDVNRGIVKVLKKKVKQKKSTDYIRLFEGTGMPLLPNTITYKHYTSLECMAIFRNNLWTAYMPKKHKQRTLSEGLDLFSSKRKFENYKKDFEEYIKRSEKFLSKIVKKKKISIKELKNSFDLIDEHFEYYQKTDFFYVDKAYEKSKTDEVTRKNLKELEGIKNSGRIHLNKLLYGGNSYLSKIIKILSKQFNQKIEDLSFYTANEIFELFDGKTVENKTLNERKRSYSFIIEDGKEKLLQGEESESFIENFLVLDLSTKEIKGIVANPGKVQGKAKVIRFGYDDFDEVHKEVESMEKGDILIAETTAPELMEACKKASAIVTNQGGLLSHAAIVSRELGIPCIVGTEIAVEVIKGGDKIELGATGKEGFVRILTKEKKLPKIMYDQTQFTGFHLIDKNGASFSEKEYNLMEKISGYKPSKWYLYSQAKPESFFFGAYDEDALEKEAEYGLKCLKDKKFVEKFEQAFSKMYKKAWNIKEIYSKEFKDKEIKQIKNNPKKVVDFLNNLRKEINFMYGYYLLTQPQRFYRVEKEIESSKESKNLIVLIESGRDLSPLVELRFDFLKYVEKIHKSGLDADSYNKKHPNEFDKIKRKIDKFGFLNKGLFGGKELNLKEMEKELQEVLENRGKFEGEVSQLRKQQIKINKRNKLFEQHKSQGIYLIAELAGQMLFYRIAIQTYVFAITNYYYCLLDKLAETHSISRKDLDTYSFNEIISLVKERKILDENEVENRKKGFLIIYSNDGTQTLFGDEAHKEIKDLLEHRKKEIEESKDLKGQIASWPIKNSKIKGKAFVLTSAFDADEKVKKFEEGDILVATQTHPNLVPIMRKAKAIVADEGGLICHASIVSRELGKPCIVGTRVGSKIIRDNDLIEIDGKKGVVKLIEKNKEEYTLHFRGTGIPFSLIELMFSKEGYGAFDYVVFYTDKIVEGYLNKEGQDQTKEFGLQLLDNHEEVYKKLVKFKSKLENFSSTDWEDLKLLIREFGELYRYCEQPMLAGIEEIFMRNCSNVDECLRNPDKCDIEGDGKKALDILVKFGKIKYDLHIAIEKPMRILFKLLSEIPYSNYLTEKEIDEILAQKSNKIIKKLAEKGSKREGIVIAKGKISYNYDAWKEKVKGKDEYKGIVKGTGVSSGKARGKVKLFISFLDYEEIPDGSVVVSGMTNPQVVPYLKKAVALVTDEGGLMCHAAIVSRELRIPGVVGTQNATQVLKDGDLVEVDAGKGVVKILKKNKD